MICWGLFELWPVSRCRQPKRMAAELGDKGGRKEAPGGLRLRGTWRGVSAELRLFVPRDGLWAWGFAVGSDDLERGKRRAARLWLWGTVSLWRTVSEGLGFVSRSPDAAAPLGSGLLPGRQARRPAPASLREGVLAG